VTAPPSQPIFDLIIRNGDVYDGSGGAAYIADVAVRGDTIAEIGPLPDARAAVEIDAAGMAVAPGFINMLSHSYMSMLQDRRSLGELKQGVTLQVFGEGNSMGPLNDDMFERMRAGMAEEEMPVDVTWRSLAEYLSHAEAFGLSQNIASYIGATSLRQYAVGADDRPATEKELDTMRGLVRDEMSAGALGIGSSLIYPPAFFASTEELIELCKAASPYGGKYISHMRSEADELIEAVEELMRISREGGVPAEIYHLKAAGKTTGTRWTPSSGWSRRRVRPASASPPTCTCTQRARRGCRTRSRRRTTTAARASCSSGSRIRRSGRRSGTRSSTRATGGRTCTGGAPVRRACSSSACARRRTGCTRASIWARWRR
jgi:N-acyl-D-amino-acid deacylase